MQKNEGTIFCWKNLGTWPEFIIKFEETLRKYVVERGIFFTRERKNADQIEAKR